MELCKIMPDLFVDSHEDPKWYEDVRLIVVQADSLHIWEEEKHYTSAEMKDEVDVGDIYVFKRGYLGEGFPLIVEVTELKERDSGKYAVFNDGEEMHVGFILGEPMQMGQLPPPTRLKEVD